MTEDVNIVPESQGTEGATIIAQEDTPKEVSTTQEPGSKTDPSLLLKSLQEERQKVKILEEQLLTKTNTEEEVFSDEGKLLQQQIKVVEEKILLKDLSEKFPALKDKASEFKDYRNQYPGVELEKLAKLFLVENDLNEVEPRKGLEKQTGGMRTPQKQGMTVEEVADLRKNNFKKYLQLAREGKINFQ